MKINDVQTGTPKPFPFLIVIAAYFNQPMSEEYFKVETEMMEEMMTNTGKTLSFLTFQSPVLLVFLRHFGCVFCKEALDDIAQRRASIEKSGIQIVFVHMSDDETAQAYFSNYKLKDATYICDPNQRYYTGFGLNRGSFNQLYGLQTWFRGFKLQHQKGYSLELAKKLGDSTQMPGVFVLQDGEIREKFIHNLASDRPDYEQLVQCCVI